MFEEDEVSDLVAAIYDAALDLGLWPDVLDRLRRTVGYRAGGIVHVQANSPCVAIMGTTGLDPAMAGRMPELFGHPDHDPYGRHLPLLKPGAPTTRRVLMDDEAFERTRIYTDFLEPQGLYHDITTPMGFWQGEFIGMFLSRPRADGPTDKNDIRALRPWIQHLQRALRIGRELGVNRAENSLLNELLERIACGVVLVCPGGKIVAMNKAAERIANSDDGLASRDGWLVTSSRRDSTELNKAIAGAADGKIGGNLTVRRPSRACAYQVFTMPLSQALAANWPGAPSAAILISDPDGAIDLPAGAVADLYGLSPAETVVAIETAKGLGLAAVAARLGISRNTAKTHMSRIFEKTGADRQAALVRLLLAGSARLSDIPGKLR